MFRKGTFMGRMAPLAWALLGWCVTLGGPVLAAPPPDDTDPIAALLEPNRPLQRLGYAIQVGAFSNLDNAVRLERQLDAQGLDAYYFRHESGLYKVRFGNHSDYQSAKAEADKLRQLGLIDTFFIVDPAAYASAGTPKDGELRNQLVATARRFLGVPYRWGGSDRDEGFDCSGLTMACFRLNGLNLPRISRNQFQSGHQVPRSQLQKGDLVFFATRGGSQVSHVGLYIGGGQFIHAPRTGQRVQVENLSQPYYAGAFVGGRSYL